MNNKITKSAGVTVKSLAEKFRKSNIKSRGNAFLEYHKQTSKLKVKMNSKIFNSAVKRYEKLYRAGKPLPGRLATKENLQHSAG